MTLQMRTAAVRLASRQWQEQSELLDGSRKNLAQAQPALLGDRVGAAAEAFLTSWERHVLNLRDAAAEHGDSLAQAMFDLLVTDRESVQRTQHLLMWSDRDVDTTPEVGR